MTPLTRLLAPSIAPLVARRDLVRESLRATDHDFDTTDLQAELRTLEADIERLEAEALEAAANALAREHGLPVREDDDERS